MKVNKDRLVRLQYELYVVNPDGSRGELIEATSEDMPLEFIHGMGLMLSHFEAELNGLEEGDKFDFVLQPENAYDTPREDLKLTLPREAFLVDGEFDSEMVYVGAMVPMLTDDGQRVEGLVESIEGEEIHMDFNHPLAGKALNFIGQIQEVKEPTPEEYQAILQPMMGGGCSGCGHDHSDGCGGGCDSGCGCN